MKSPDSWTFGEFAQEIYLSQMEARVKASTLKRYRRELVTISPWFWDLPLSAITKSKVAQFAAERKAEGVRARTVNMGIQQVRHVLQVAHDLDYIPYPPPKFKRLKENDKRPVRWLKPQEADAVLEVARGAGGPWAAFVIFSLHVGTRFNEARNLLWRDLELDPDGAGSYVHITQTKNSKPRTIPLLPEVVEAIQQLPKRSKYVFTVENWSRKSGEAGKKIDRIPDFSQSGRRRYPWDPPELKVNPHMFRHTFAAWQLRAGVSIAIVSSLLGHSSVQVTVDIYGHIQPEEHLDELAKVHRPAKKTS